MNVWMNESITSYLLFTFLEYLFANRKYQLSVNRKTNVEINNLQTKEGEGKAIPMVGICKRIRSMTDWGENKDRACVEQEHIYRSR